MSEKIKINRWFKVRKNVVRDGLYIIYPGQWGWALIDDRKRYCFFFSKYQKSLYLDREETIRFCKNNKVEKHVTLSGLSYSTSEEQKEIDTDYFNAINQ